jgi:hypothetical protein
VVLDAVVVTVGVAFTVIVRVLVLVQPFAPVPVTVYVVVVVGETVTGDPLSEPGIHAYVDAPPPVSVVELPEQIVVLDAVVVTVGKAFTVMTCVMLLLPLAFVAVSVTVYVPAVFHTTPVTFCVVAEAGVPLGNVQLHEVGEPVDPSVKFTAVPAHTVVTLEVNAAVGGAAAALPVRLTLST